MKRFVLPTLLLFASSALAVSTSYWTQTTDNDFKAGTLEGVVATSLGELKLSRAIKSLMDEDPRISTINKLIEGRDHVLYAATGPNAILLQVKDQKVTELGQIPDATELLSLAIDKQGRLLVGTASDHAAVYRFDKPGDKPTAIALPDGVQYVWALQATDDGNIYAATGPSGKLFAISPQGQVKTLLETDENNLLSLISDGKNLLYVGTDPHGLVYRVDRQSGQSFVLYNAAESEVTALALDRAGNLYAATGEARDEQTPNGPPAADTGKSGSPEGGSTGAPIPSGGPDEPKPPAPPDPNPGRPNPIPKSPQSRATLLDLDLSDTPVLQTLADQNPPGKRPPVPGQPQPATAPAEPQSQPPHQPQVDTSQTGEARPEGNAIYRIDPDGFVTEVFRQPVLVLSMVENNGVLLIGTGSDGQIFQINPKAEETQVLAKVDSKQVTCLLPASDGQIYVGMSNVGNIATMSDGFAPRGTFISPVLDATQISRFGKMQMHGSLPPGTELLVSTRSGNVKEASDKTWSKWTDDVPASQFLPVTSPTARFLQYRLTLSSGAGNQQTPVVDDLTIAYQIPNLPPQIKSIRVVGSGDAATQGSGGNGGTSGNGGGSAGPNAGQATTSESKPPQPSPTLTIAWEASDPNGDALTFTLFFRRGSDEPWIQLADKLTESSYEWDTRSVADGRYQVRVVASDASSNAPGEGKTASRISEPVVVDNTPPVIGDVKWKQAGANLHVSLRAVDRTSTVASVEYAVDSAKDWQLVLPSGTIYDSPEAVVGFDLKGLTPGKHQVALRATDSKGNQAFENLLVKVEGPAAMR